VLLLGNEQARVAKYLGPLDPTHKTGNLFDIARFDAATR
jgi:hypothetical protein